MEKIPSEKPINLHPELSEEEEPPGKPTFIDEASLLDEYLKSRNDRDKSVISERSLTFLQTYFPEAGIKDWNNWHWQIKNSARSIEQLSRYIRLSDNEVRPEAENSQTLPLRITPYYISLLDTLNADQALRKSVVPVFDEFLVHRGEASDPDGRGTAAGTGDFVRCYPPQRRAPWRAG